MATPGGLVGDARVAWDLAARAEVARPGTVPFGQYRGKPLGALASDPGYCRWLLTQPDLLDRYPQVRDWLEAHPPGDAAAPGAAWESPVEREVARYPYRDGSGALRYTVIRHNPKRFAIEAASGSPLPDPVPRELACLYRLPELLAAPAGETVFLAEGEKDADTLAVLGLVATTMPCGTRMGWLPSYTPHLAGRHVVIVPDADGPGRRHAEKVLDEISETATSCVVMDLHEGGRGPWDVTDWLARRGRSGADLLAQVERARLESAGYAPRRDGTPLPRDRQPLIWGSALDSTAKLVLLAICHLAVDGAALPAASQIASACSLHRVTAQHTIARLREAGVLAAGRETRIGWGILAVAVW